MIREALLSCGLERFCTEDNLEKLETLSSLLSEYNEKVNLTAVRTPQGIALRHIADSLTVSRHLPAGAHIADIGTGGGFPALPLAVCRPDLTVTAVDSTAKKLTFVSFAAEKLGLTNITTLCARAEELGKDPYHREKYDAVVSRAVAALPALSELCLPLVRVGGVFAAMKGSDGQAEAEQAKKAIGLLGGDRARIDSFALIAPDGFAACGEDAQSERVIVTVVKTSPTPEKYPRDFAQIRKKPI